MIFVEVDPVMMHASSVPASSRMLAVFTDAAMAVAHVAPEFPGLPQSGWHGGGRKERALLYIFIFISQYILSPKAEMFILERTEKLMGGLN